MSQGCLGIGLALVAGPALVAIDPAFAPGPLIVVAQIVGVRNVVVERSYTDRQAVGRCAIGLPFGLGAGLVVLSLVSDEVIALLVGSLAAAGALSLLCGLRIVRSPRIEVATGAAVGFSSMTAALPGPPFVVTFSDMKPATLRGTVGSVFFMTAVAAMIGLLATGKFGTYEVELIGWLVPGIILGLFLARFVRPFLDRTWFRPAVLLVALAGGIALILRQIL